MHSAGELGPNDMLESLRKDIEKLLDTESCRKQIGDLEQQVNNLQLSEAFGAAGDRTAAKEKIDKLIKEIDKCISLLEN